MNAIVIVLVALGGADAPSTAGLPAPIPLLCGNITDHFYTFIRDRGRDNDPKQVFTVQDGILRVSGEEWGCITTKEEYDNYRLVAEFKWGDRTFAPREERARDCGILVHSVGEDGAYGNAWMRSIECQIIEGGTGDFIVVGDDSEDFAITCAVAPEKVAGCHVYQPGGELATIHGGRVNWWGRDPEWKDEKGFRGARDAEKAVGEWNRLECLVQDDEISVILNGVEVNHAQNVHPRRGKIQVQSEGAEIFFRKIELLPLKP
ncbi:MAG: 3-keto-disaccharide hydrolase [Candidatus Hydrogenedentales bacterium]